MRLIDADALIEIFDKDEYERVRNEYESGYNDGLLHAEVVADDMPTVDAVPVTQCKDCVNCRKSTLAGRTWKHCAFIGNVVYDDNYCCWAERKEE